MPRVWIDNERPLFSIDSCISNHSAVHSWNSNKSPIIHSKTKKRPIHSLYRHFKRPRAVFSPPRIIWYGLLFLLYRKGPKGIAKEKAQKRTGRPLDHQKFIFFSLLLEERKRRNVSAANDLSAAVRSFPNQIREKAMRTGNAQKAPLPFSIFSNVTYTCQDFAFFFFSRRAVSVWSWSRVATRRRWFVRIWWYENRLRRVTQFKVVTHGRSREIRRLMLNCCRWINQSYNGKEEVKMEEKERKMTTE